MLKYMFTPPITAVFSFHVRLGHKLRNCGRVTNEMLKPQIFIVFINLIYIKLLLSLRYLLTLFLL
jgi:hypothetical protein